jgi:aspartyl-tRNA(Asn)/glutamyl-tRNA(Gln) amidotransferase subunit A
MPATELAGAVRRSEVSPVEVVEAVLDRIEATQPTVNAFITVCAERAMSEAREAAQAVARGGDVGPLHAVPFSVKDLVATAGVRTTWGSLARADHVPAADAVAVARLRAAGAILVGKTTTPEFGHKPLTEAPLFGRTANPWDLSRTSGGSSGGSAAAVAAGAGPLSVGTDGGGSTRIPSACCGVVGMKPTLGVVPHDLTSDAFGNLAYLGPIARTVADAAQMLDVMAGPHPADPHSLAREVTGLAAGLLSDLAGVRVGWRTFFGNDRIDGETRTLFEAAVPALADAGAQVTPHDDVVENTYLLWAPLTFSFWASRYADVEVELGDRMSASLRHWMAEGRTVSGTEVRDAEAARTTLYRQVQGWFDDIDLLVTPTLACPAIPVDSEATGDVVIEGEPVPSGYRAGWYPYTHPFNLTGHPAITVPCGWTSDGLPVGLQIVGRWFEDALVLRAAAALEGAQPWAHLRPPI